MVNRKVFITLLMLVTLTVVSFSGCSSTISETRSAPPKVDAFIVETAVGKAILEDYQLDFNRGCYQKNDGTIEFCKLSSPEDPSSRMLGKALVCSSRKRLVKIIDRKGIEYPFEGKMCVGFHDKKDFAVDVLFISASPTSEFAKQFFQSTLSRYGESLALKELDYTDRDRTIFLRPIK